MSATILLAAIPVIVADGQTSLSAGAISAEVARISAGRRGLRALSEEELFVSARPEIIDEVRACGADESCMSERLSTVRADLGAIVVVNLVADPPIVAVRLVEVRGKRMAASAIGPLGPREREIIAAIGSRLGALLDELGHRQEGRIVVQPTPEDARVEIAGSAVAGNAFALPPGRYEVIVSRDGYRAAVLPIDVTAGGEQSMFPVLEAEAQWFESPWLWIGIGAALAAGVTAAVIATRDPSRVACIGPEEECR